MQSGAQSQQGPASPGSPEAGREPNRRGRGGDALRSQRGIPISSESMWTGPPSGRVLGWGRAGSHPVGHRFCPGVAGCGPRACCLEPRWARAVDRLAAGGGRRLASAVPGGQPGWADPLPRPVEMWRIRRHATPGPAPRARTFLLSFPTRPLPLRSESSGSGCEHRRHFLCSLPASRRRPAGQAASRACCL